MIQSHISREDLLEMLQGDGQSQKTEHIGDHLHECAACRKELDALTANSEIWQKTPDLLKDALESSAAIRSVDDETLDRPFNSDSDSQEPTWQYPVDTLLDPPRHPEMMGRLGKYEIEREIGRGGMGIVFKAHDAELNRPLAIKVLAPHLASHGTARLRFAQEARAAAGVLHPNVIAVHGVNNEGKTPYIVMPFVAGPSLQMLVEKRGPLPEIEIVRIARQIAAGLSAAHSQGLVHRDIKPANILVEDGVHRVLIMDFGLARAEDDASLTRTGWLTGTPNYMSPEQTRGERIDQRSDLFSLGSLVYFLTTGRLPFRAESPLGVLNRIQSDQPTPVRQVNRLASLTLSQIIDRLLEKKPQHRFQTAGDLHEVLEKHLAYLHQPDISKPPIVKPVAQSPLGGLLNSVWSKVIAAGLVASLAVGGSLYYSGAFTPDLDGSSPSPNVSQKEDGPGSPPALDLNGLASTPNGGTTTLPPIQDPPPTVIPVVINTETTESTTSEGFDRVQADAKVLINQNPESPGELVALNSEFDLQDDEIEDSDDDDDQDFKDEQAFDAGYTLIMQGDYEDAIREFKKVVKFRKATATYNIGCAQALQGKPKEAIASLEQAVQLGFDDLDQIIEDEDLDSLRTSKSFANVMNEIKRSNRVSELVSTAIQLNGSQQYAAAEKIFLKAIKLDPTNANAGLNLGYSLHMQGKLEEAKPWHEKTAASQDYAGLGNYNMACYYSLKNQTDQAIEAFEKAIATDIANSIDLHHIDEDTDLDAIRNDRRFSIARRKFRAKSGFDSHSHFEMNNGRSHIMSNNFTEFPSGLALVEIEGEWKAELFDDVVDLKITRSSDVEKWSWSYNNDFKRKDFTPELNESVNDFQLKKQSGSLVFIGNFADQKGEGKFSFEADSSYREELAQQGIIDAPDAALFRLFFTNNTKNIIGNLKDLNELDIPKDVLQLLMAENVDARLVKKYQREDLDLKQHLTLIIHRVKPKLIMDYQDANLDLTKHQKFVVNRVPAKLLTDYQNNDLDFETYKEFIQHRVPASLLSQYLSSNLDLVEHKQFIQNRVPTQLLQDYTKAGFKLDAYKSFILQRVNSETLKRYSELGYDPNEYRAYVQRRVPVALLRDYSNLKLDDQLFSRYLYQQVPADLIKSYLDADFSPEAYDSFLQHRVKVDSLKAYQAAGFEPLKFKRLIHRHVPVAWAKKYQSAGLNPNEHLNSLTRRIEPDQAKADKQDDGCDD